MNPAPPLTVPQPSTTTQNVTTPLPREPLDLPDHTQLPDSDDNFVKNFQEHPQNIIELLENKG
jgi:hypothetical protein